MRLPVETIIVENDVIEMKTLKDFLSIHKGVFSIVESVYFYSDAVKILSERSFQVSILDINLGESGDCYDLINDVGRGRFGILVITTIQSAVPPEKAHSVKKPVIFFPKPHTPERVIKLIRDLNETIAEIEASEVAVKKIWIEDAKGTLIPFEENSICCVDANKKMTIVYSLDSKSKPVPFNSSESFGALLKKLDSNNFVQCHRSTIVNVNHIGGFKAKKKNGRMILFKQAGGPPITYSTTYIKMLAEKLNVNESDL